MNDETDNRGFMLVTLGLALAAWIRTTEAIYFVSPQNFLTFTGVEIRYAYAAFNAAWIEFTIIYIINRFAKVRGTGWIVLFCVMLALFSISFSAQGIDAAIVTERTESLPIYLQVMLYYVLPSIATILLFFVALSHAFTTRDTNAVTQPKQDKPKGKIQSLYDAMYDAAMHRLTQSSTPKRTQKPVVSPATTPEQTQMNSTVESPKAQPPDPKE